MPLINDVLHPVSYTVDHSLSGVQAHAILRLRTRVTQSPDCAHVLPNLEIVQTCYTISRLPVQSRDSENAQRNLEIAQILRFHGTYILSQITHPLLEVSGKGYELC